MIDPKQLLTGLQKRVTLLEDDLRPKEADRIMTGQNQDFFSRRVVDALSFIRFHFCALLRSLRPFHSERFMESEHLQNIDVSWGHEPKVRKALEIKESMLRFMGREPVWSPGFSRWDCCNTSRVAEFPRPFS